MEPLSRRESQILALLERKLTNREIAGELQLALSSVKWHIRQICAKLGVQNRRQAVERALELGLLNPGFASRHQPDNTPPKNNLPTPLTSFIGREKEINEALRLVREHRLVTLTSVGGVGKSRLSVQLASRLLEEFPHGAWQVDLAPIQDPSLVPQAFIDALNLQVPASQTAQAVLLASLKTKHILLVMDNCEHLLKTCTQLAEAYLAASPGLHILATSREALGIDDEYVYRVPSLSFPGLPSSPTPEELNQYEAVALFAERARQIQPDFAITKENATAVATICQRLDGIPLALELAAACIGVLSVEGIAERLEDRFRLLIRGSRGKQPQQRTLLASIGWSYNLLTATEQILFRRLSIFVGGWTLGAAEAIIKDDGEGIWDDLTSLVRKSLVIAESGPDAEPRYRMLESIREYAQEILEESGEIETLRMRRAHFYLNLAREAEPQSRGPQPKAWLTRLDADYGNIRAALDWSLGGGAVEAGLRAAPDLFWFWRQRGLLAEGRIWLDTALALAGSVEDRAIRAEILVHSGAIAWEQGDIDTGEKRIEESVVICRELGDRRLLAIALYYSSLVKQGKDRYYEHLAALEESARLFQEIGDDWRLATALQWLGNEAYLRGEKETGRSYLEESERSFRQLDSKAGLAWSLQILASFDWDTGEIERARARFQESLALHRLSGERLGEGWALSYLGDLEYTQAKGPEGYHQAEKYYQEGAELFRMLGWRDFGFCSLLHRLGRAVHIQGDQRRAIELYREALATGMELVKTDPWYVSLILIGPAEVAIEQRKPGQGARLLGALAAISGTFLETAHPIHLKDYQMVLAKAQSHLNEAAFQSALVEGRELTLEQAIREGISILS